MFKKPYTSPALKTMALTAENIICGSGTNITVDNKNPYNSEFGSDTHAWDSSNWADADSEE